MTWKLRTKIKKLLEADNDMAYLGAILLLENVSSIKEMGDYLPWLAASRGNGIEDCVFIKNGLAVVFLSGSVFYRTESDTTSYIGIKNITKRVYL